MPTPRVPTAVKALKGTLQPCRVNKNEPEPKIGRPPMPRGLSERAKAAWKDYAADMELMGVLTMADGKILHQLAQAFADWQEAVEFLDKNGTTYIVTKSAPDGTTFEDFKQYPQVMHRNDADKRLRMLEKDCGLTPSDRSKVSATEQKEESAWAGVLQ